MSTFLKFRNSPVEGEHFPREGMDTGQVFGTMNSGVVVAIIFYLPRDSAFCILTCRWRINTMAVKRSDPRNAVQLTTQTPDDFMRGFCRS